MEHKRVRYADSADPIDEVLEQMLLRDTQATLQQPQEVAGMFGIRDDKSDAEGALEDPFEQPFDFFSSSPSVMADDLPAPCTLPLFGSLYDYPSLIDGAHQSTSTAQAVDHGHLSSQRLKWIKNIFRSSKGSRFGSQKRDIAFLLLSNCPVPSELTNLLEDEKALRNILLRSRGMLHLICHCPHKECMINVLGWEHKKSQNIARAAELFGPAIAYCIPEKQSIVDFLRVHQSTPVDSVLRVDLQDDLFNYLDIYVKSTQLNISAESLISFETSSCVGQEFIISGASTLDDLAKKVFAKMDIPVDQEYQFEMFDGRVANSHKSVSSFRCPHQIQTCTTFTQLKFFYGAKLKLMFFESSSVCKASSLKIILLSIRSVELHDRYCILN